MMLAPTSKALNTAYKQSMVGHELSLIRCRTAHGFT